MQIISSINKKGLKGWINVGLGLFLFLSVASYAFWKTKNVFFTFSVEANIEKSGISSTASVIGNAKNASMLTLNGREISIDKEGNFDEKVTLLPGLSVITLSAQDKFGKTSEKDFEVVYKENNQVALISK